MAEKTVSFQIKKLAAIRAIAMMLMCVSLFFYAGCVPPEEGPDDNGSVDGGNNNGGNNNGGGSNTGGVKNVTAVGSSSSSITVSWNAVVSATRYYIYISEDASGPYREIDWTYSDNLSRTISKLATATTYYFKVKGTKDGGTTVLGESSAVSASTLLTAPTGVKAQSLTSSSITITWNNFPNATGYRIYKSESSSSSATYTEIGTSTTNTYTDEGLSPKTRYYYKVSARNKDDLEGDQSSSVEAIVLLPAPKNVTAVGSSSSSITVSWNAVVSATRYYIYISEDASGPYREIDWTYSDNLSRTISKLATATTYYFKVKAGDGQLSEPVSATTN